MFSQKIVVNSGLETPSAPQQNIPQPQHESAQIDIHVLPSNDQSIDKSGFTLLDGPTFFSHQRLTYKALSSGLLPCIESTIQRRSSLLGQTPITDLRISTHDGVREITMHINAAHVCIAPMGIANIRLRALGRCVLTLASTFLGKPLWEAIGIQEHPGCVCATRHTVSIDGFVRPLPYYGLRSSRLSTAGSYIPSRLGVHQAAIELQSAGSLPHSILTYGTADPPVCVPEPLNFTVGGDFADNEIRLAIKSSDSIEDMNSLFSLDDELHDELNDELHYGLHDELHSEPDLPGPIGLVPPDRREATTHIKDRAVSFSSDSMPSRPSQSVIRKISLLLLDEFGSVEDILLKEPSENCSSPIDEPASATSIELHDFLPGHEAGNEEALFESEFVWDDESTLCVVETDGTGSSICSTAVANTSVSTAPLPVATDCLLFLAYLSGAMHAFEHTSQSAGRGQPFAAYPQSCVCVPDPPEVDLNKYIMGVFLSTAAASQKNFRHDTKCEALVGDAM